MPWSAQIHTEFHVYGATQDTTNPVWVLNYGTITLYGYIFQCIRITHSINIMVLQPHRNKFLWFGLFRVRSPLLTESILFLFLRILRCFTSPRIAQISYEFRFLGHHINGAGFPHSEIFGSKRACRSPKLIAACCVLRRLMKPRHPPTAVTGYMQTLISLGV